MSQFDYQRWLHIDYKYFLFKTKPKPEHQTSKYIYQFTLITTTTTNVISTNTNTKFLPLTPTTLSLLYKIIPLSCLVFSTWLELPHAIAPHNSDCRQPLLTTPGKLIHKAQTTLQYAVILLEMLIKPPNYSSSNKGKKPLNHITFLNNLLNFYCTKRNLILHFLSRQEVNLFQEFIEV